MPLREFQLQPFALSEELPFFTHHAPPPRRVTRAYARASPGLAGICGQSDVEIKPSLNPWVMRFLYTLIVTLGALSMYADAQGR